MKGDDGSRIKQGNSLSEDKHIGERFNFMMANPDLARTGRKFRIS
jgi:type I restriction-modification system DNA methylase subunit